MEFILEESKAKVVLKDYRTRGDVKFADEPLNKALSYDALKEDIKVDKSYFEKMSAEQLIAYNDGIVISWVKSINGKTDREEIIKEIDNVISDKDWTDLAGLVVENKVTKPTEKKTGSEKPS